MHSFSSLPQIGPGHAALKDFAAYRDNQQPNPERLVPVEGLWAHSVALKLGLEIRTAFICPELLKSPDYQKAATDVMARARRSFAVSAKAFEKISERDGPSGVASLIKPTNLFQDDFAALKNIKHVVLMDAVEVPGNIGTLLRSLDGLGQSALVLTNKRVRLNHPKVIKGSLGAIFTVPIIVAELKDALNFIKKEQLPLLAADSSRQNKIRMVDFSLAQVPESFALFLGSEKYGLPQEVYDAQPQGLTIPMSGMCDSLNVSIAASIMLYGLTKRAPSRPQAGQA